MSELGFASEIASFLAANQKIIDEIDLLCDTRHHTRSSLEIWPTRMDAKTPRRSQSVKRRTDFRTRWLSHLGPRRPTLEDRMQKLARLRIENAALREEHRAMMAKFEEQQRAMEEIREAIAINEDKIIAMCPDYYPGWSV